MQQTYRATRWLRPEQGYTVFKTRDEALRGITALERKLTDKLSKPDRATMLCARASLYAAVGDPRMLETAEEAYKFCKMAETAALVAAALHHHGRLAEANEFYKRSYKYPHEPGWEIDLSYAQSLMMQGKYQNAWPIVKTLKKRMVYAAYLKTWDGKPCDEVSIISEGGFGDIVHMSRYLPLVTERVKHVTVYLPPFFYEHGFSYLARRQPWFPEIKPLAETPQHVPAAGFFDLPGIFDTAPETIPLSPVWKADRYYKANLKRLEVGVCWGARAMETPIVADGVYRTLRIEDAQKIVSEKSVDWVSLQKGETLPGVQETTLNVWEDTAAIISRLDLVITVDTGVMHLAAAMGKPVWLLLSGASDWKFGMASEKCLWYPTVRLFRNNAFGFENAVRDVISAIQEESCLIVQRQLQA